MISLLLLSLVGSPFDAFGLGFGGGGLLMSHGDLLGGGRGSLLAGGGMFPPGAQTFSTSMSMGGGPGMSSKKKTQFLNSLDF